MPPSYLSLLLHISLLVLYVSLLVLYVPLLLSYVPLLLSYVPLLLSYVSLLCDMFHCYMLYFMEGGGWIFEKKTFQKLVVSDSLHLDRQKFITVFMCICYMYIHFL